MVVGTPGGSTIITSVFQTILNVIDYGMGGSRRHNEFKKNFIASGFLMSLAKLRKIRYQKNYVMI